tara:strand:+ start:1170 stop:2417 length:1248 start_codon:yes stop_codon:yes gene_type:complete
MATLYDGSTSSAGLPFSNEKLNSVGSSYASTFTHATSNLVQKLTNRAIFDAAPQQYMDLKLLNMVPAETVNSDEFFFQEMGYQRSSITATGGAAAGAAGATQTIAIGAAAIANISTNTIISYPNGVHATVTALTATEMVVTPSNSSGGLPTVNVGDVFANISTVDHDGSEGFTQYFRAAVTEKYNYVQLFNKAIRYSEVELHKLKNAGTTDNYLSMERSAMFNQHRIDLSNAFWSGKRDEVVLANGRVAKTTGGVLESITGSSLASTSAATIVAGFEALVLATEYGDYGSVRFAYMTPAKHLLLSKAYKDQLTRYAPNDDIASLQLKEVNLGSSRIVLVPYKRFEDTASFPASMSEKIVILDHKNIKRVQLWGERSGDTLKLEDGIAKRFGDVYVDANMGIKFNNPLACGILTIT